MAPSSWLAIAICLGVLAAMVAVGRWAARLTAEDYLVRGLNAHSLGQHELAVAEFDRAIEQAPRAPEAFFNRAQAMAKLERLDEAVKDLNTVIALRRDFPDAFSQRAALLALQGKHALAAADYTEAIRQASYDDQAYLGRADAYHALGWIEQSLADYERALALNPLNPAIPLNRARLLLLAGKTTRALADYETAFARGLSDPLAYGERAQTLMTLKRWEPADADYTILIEMAPEQSAAERAAAYAARAYVRYQLGRRADALADWAAALALAPTAAAYVSRGAVWIEMERYDEAIRDLDQALALEPEHALAWNNRGFAHYRLKRCREALADYERAVRHGFATAGVFINITRAYENLGDLEAAHRAIVKAIDAEPANVWGYDHRARIRVKLDWAASAWRADFDQALALEPENSKILNNAAWFLALGGAPDEALALAERALALDDDPVFRDTRGLCLALLGRFEEAIPDFAAYADTLRPLEDSQSSASLAQLEQWIDALRAGENPFTPDVLAALRRDEDAGTPPGPEQPAA